jgi:hypothetical protein
LKLIILLIQLSGLIFFLILSPILLISFLLKSKSFFIGIIENCESIKLAKEALKKNLKSNVITYAIIERRAENNIYDYKILKYKFKYKLLFYIYFEIYNLYVFFKTIFFVQVYIFYWNKSFLILNIDYFVLKLLGKKIILFHIGNDARVNYFQDKIFKNLNLDYKYFNKKIKFMDFSLKLYRKKIIDFLNLPLFTNIDTETFLTKYQYHFIIPQKKIVHYSSKLLTKKTTILHAPTDKKIKGTIIVRKAIEILKKNNFKIKYIEVINKKNSEVIKYLRKTTILIDQPGIWIGKLAVEGMSSSCIVLGGNIIPEKYSIAKSPIIQFPNNSLLLSKILINIINKSEHNKKKIIKKNYLWFNKYYSALNYSKAIDSVLQNKKVKDLPPINNLKKILLKSSPNLLYYLIIKICL